MKTALLCLTMILASLFSGCATLIDEHLPNGKAANVRYTRTGKFSSTTIEAVNFEKSAERVKADRLTFKHANAWMPNVELTAEGYEREVTTKK